MTFFWRKKWRVIWIDNLLTGENENIAHLIGNPKFKFINFKYKIVVNESTVLVGTSAIIKDLLKEASLVAGEDFDVASNPEFLREGMPLKIS